MKHALRLIALGCDLRWCSHEPEFLKGLRHIGREIQRTVSEPEVKPFGTVTDAKKRKKWAKRVAVVEGECSQGVSSQKFLFRQALEHLEGDSKLCQTLLDQASKRSAIDGDRSRFPNLVEVNHPLSVAFPLAELILA